MTHVKTFRILGTSTRVAEAWEPYTDHGTMQTIDGVRMGKVGTKRAPKELIELPDEQRYHAVMGWYENQYMRAYEAILAEHPEFAAGVQRNAEIVMEVA